MQVSLEYQGSQHCAGSIINNYYILTAAHCLKNELYPTRYSVLVGTVKLSEGGTRYNVSSIKKHEDYFFENVTNDIGIVKLEEPLTFNKYVKPIA
ncbi:Chymotrypsin-1, partial [Blattella germanica]